MTKLLIRLFIKDSENTASCEVRKRYGYLGSFTGIALNFLLFAAKLMAGILSGAISVVADAFNNLSDAGASVMTFIGFKMAGMPADSDHPYGHGRMEYVSGLVISFIIMMMGFELAKASIDSIISPSEDEFSPIAFGILLASLCIKLWMALFNRKLGRLIDSSAMKAAAADSLSDCISTGVVAAAMLVRLFFGITLDGYAGIIVAIFIFCTGIGTFKESLTPLLGTVPEKQLVEDIHKTVMSYPQIVGVHDLMVHDYGVGRMVISLHAEVNCTMDFIAAHELIDLIEDDLKQQYKSSVTIHMDPVAVNDAEIDKARATVEKIIKELDERLTIHDFRMTGGTSRVNLIFDLVVPYKFKYSDALTVEMVQNKISHADERYNAVITVEKPMC